MYKCVIYSNSSMGREYDVATKSAMRCADKMGRADFGEVVTVYTKTGKPISRVIWSAEQRKYIRVGVDPRFDSLDA